MNLEAIQTFLSTTALALGIKVLAAIAFWVISRWIIGKVVTGVRSAMERSKVDPTLI